MFRDTNNATMGLVMQGYSDSIKDLQNNSIENAFRTFGDGLANTVSNYHTIEQQKLNKDLTQENIQAQKLENKYNTETMNDRIIQQRQQTMKDVLENEYPSKTMNDRVKQQGYIAAGMKLDNESKTLSNKEATDTSEKRVKAMNAQYGEDSARATWC